eukprot:scaffold1166_cov261-Pinguiococcus_pyrenoidosus.AAC.1
MGFDERNGDPVSASPDAATYRIIAHPGYSVRPSAPFQDPSSFSKLSSVSIRNLVVPPADLIVLSSADSVVLSSADLVLFSCGCICFLPPPSPSQGPYIAKAKRLLSATHCERGSCARHVVPGSWSLPSSSSLLKPSPALRHGNASISMLRSSPVGLERQSRPTLSFFIATKARLNDLGHRGALGLQPFGHAIPIPHPKALLPHMLLHVEGREEHLRIPLDLRGELDEGHLPRPIHVEVAEHGLQPVIQLVLAIDKLDEALQFHGRGRAVRIPALRLARRAKRRYRVEDVEGVLDQTVVAVAAVEVEAGDELWEGQEAVGVLVHGLECVLRQVSPLHAKEREELRHLLEASVREGLVLDLDFLHAKRTEMCPERSRSMRQKSL